MCFRPATASGNIKCPECGATNPDIALRCMSCKCDLSELTQEARASILGGEPPSPKGPGTPKAPPPKPE